MHVFFNYKKIPHKVKGNVAVTIGNFDGVHLGHQALINQLNNKKNKLEKSMVILFEPQPKEYFMGESAPKRIFSLPQKIEALSKKNIDYVLVLKFDEKLISLTAEDFIEKILIDSLDITRILVGDDFKFGKNRTGDFKLLKKYATTNKFEVERYETYYLYKQRVSSTWIRECISQGNFFLARTLLGIAA